MSKLAPGYRPRNGHEWHHYWHAGQYYAALAFLLKKSTWKRHHAPFAKTRRGLQRRQERRFARSAVSC